MENASKALIMAGGILIALLVIGILLLTINKIGDYQRSQDSSKKNSQIVNFNLDFERYVDDKGITGADIVSLINKVNDYNQKSSNNTENNNHGITNYIDYNIKMSITVTGLNKFNDKYAYNDLGKGALFNSFDTEDNGGGYIFGSNEHNKTDSNNRISTKLAKLIEEMDKAGNSIGTDRLKKLSGIYDASSNSKKADSINKIREELKRMFPNKVDEYENWNGTNINDNPKLETIIKYRQYSEFKSSKFRAYQESDYASNGQIQNLYFEFIR